MPPKSSVSPQLHAKTHEQARSPPLSKDTLELTDVTVVSGFHAAKRRRTFSDGQQQSTQEAHRRRHARAGLSELVDVASLGVPSLGAVLADPLISLVDTACVGQVSSLQLASLGPNTAIFNLIFQVGHNLQTCELRCNQISSMKSRCSAVKGHCLAGVCIPQCDYHKCTGYKLPTGAWHL